VGVLLAREIGRHPAKAPSNCSNCRRVGPVNRPSGATDIILCQPSPMCLLVPTVQAPGAGVVGLSYEANRPFNSQALCFSTQLRFSSSDKGNHIGVLTLRKSGVIQARPA
jgi:hypothetical protein